jgi:hypothetical protein
MTYAEAMTTLTRLRSLLIAGGDDSVYNEEDREIIATLYQSECGKAIRQCNCRDRYTDAVIETYITLKKRGIMASEQSYKLRPGVIIWVGNTVYSNHNLTDEVAAAYLETHPEARGKFERIPETYVSPAEEELAQKAAESKSRRSKKNTVTEEA